MTPHSSPHVHVFESDNPVDLVSELVKIMPNEVRLVVALAILAGMSHSELVESASVLTEYPPCPNAENVVLTLTALSLLMRGGRN